MNPAKQDLIGLEEWRQLSLPFFFKSKEQISTSPKPSKKLQEEYERIKDNYLLFFNHEWIPRGEWLTHPKTGFTYHSNQHWTTISDWTAEAGDIKYIWEKSRFTFLYTLIRYDHHFGVDCSEKVFAEIQDWIRHNPINQGPNYVCSQEISLRLLNWLFALMYYRQSPALNEERFSHIMQSIYWQIRHVWDHINYSRKIVRNNHALTETLTLYIMGIFFPFFPEARRWKENGKRWFEKEVEFQIYDDGTFIQHSHNYHRVLIQLLSWAFYLNKTQDPFKPDTFRKGRLALDYITHCIRGKGGQVPNYGPNDGALFFPLNNRPFSDYRPQINALHFFFDQKPYFSDPTLLEDCTWYQSSDILHDRQFKGEENVGEENVGFRSFSKGGIYTMTDDASFTFIKCSTPRHRPHQADNLHLDIWVDGLNIFRDAGTFLYNIDTETAAYFKGTRAHNTVTLDNQDQMQRGPRFLWFNWPEVVEATCVEQDDQYIFDATMKAFEHLRKNIVHQRRVIKLKNQPVWQIEDSLFHDLDLPMKQWWHPHPEHANTLIITSVDEFGKEINHQMEDGYFSGTYGSRSQVPVIVFSTQGHTIKTTIEVKQTRESNRLSQVVDALNP